MLLRFHQIPTTSRPPWILAFGFGAVVLVLLISGFLLLYAIDVAGEDVKQFSTQQLEQMELIDKVQFEQVAVGELLYTMYEDRAMKRAAQHRQEARRLRASIEQFAAKARNQQLNADQGAAWSALDHAAGLLFDSVEGSFAGGDSAQARIGPNHRRFVASVAGLLDSSYQGARVGRTEEMRRFAIYFSRSATLLGVAVVLAISGTAGSLFFTFRLFGQLEQQAGTLREFAIHILNHQEQAARRFSQELHDEFGQTLNAIETTLSVVRADSVDGNIRLSDAKAMVKDSIANAREMARLLRPSILDDFGLDASVRELARGFSQRTGIVVDYNSTLRERLTPEMETHFYRIAQEALTNVSRHSSAKRVSLDLKTENGYLRFRIRDDGGGMEPKPNGYRSLGLVGMAERAHAVGGRIQIRNDAGIGVEIFVEAPVKERTNDRIDTNT